MGSEPTSTFLLDLEGQFGAGAQQIPPGSSAALTTTRPCHSVAVLRASFTGLTGSSSYSIDW